MTWGLLSLKIYLSDGVTTMKRSYTRTLSLSSVVMLASLGLASLGHSTDSFAAPFAFHAKPVPSHLDVEGNELHSALAGTGADIKYDGATLCVVSPSSAAFSRGSDVLNANFARILDGVAVTMKQSPYTVAEIVGHTDYTGSDAINDPLSMRRAAAAKSYLVSQGIADHRVIVVGNGSRWPIADNNTAEGQALNRSAQVDIYLPMQSTPHHTGVMPRHSAPY